METLQSTPGLYLSSVSKQSLPATAKLRPAPSILQKRIVQVSQAAFSLIVTQISPDSALALDYDAVIGSGRPLDSASALGPADGVDLSVVESVVSFASENPAAVVGGVLALAVPVIVSRFLGKPKSYGTVSAAEAYKKLAVKDPSFQILDIREPADIKTEGTPDLREFRKRVLQISFGQDEAAFVNKVKSKFKDPANTTLYILDRFDGNSSTVAKLLTSNGFQEAFAIRDGAEGGRGWKQSGLPWALPRKGLSVSLDALKDAIQFEGDILPASLGVAAAAGVGLVVFSEAETALQLLGTVALLQLFAKKFLFAEDRKKTVKEIQTFLDTKVAPKELVDELKGVGKTLLPKFEEVKSTAAEAVEGNGAVVPSEPEPAPLVAASEASEVSEVTKESTPASEEKTETAPSRPLSPYSVYPDLKPPSSPSPSRP